MKKILIFAACLTVALGAFAFLSGAAEPERAPNARDEATEQSLNALNSALDELHSTARDVRPEDRSRRGANLNEAFVALTGEAVNPLFGVTALGIYNYLRCPDHLRDSLPLYDQPIIWVPLLCIILLMLFNSTICEAIPFLKVPLNALGDIVNKAGAVAVLPLVVKMFADAVAQPAAEQFAALSGVLFPVAHAGESVLSSAWLSIGWLAGAAVGFLVYAAVWLAFNVIDVLILICPFPGVDALLKSFRLSVVGLLAGVNQIAPGAAALIAAAVVLASLFLAGWSFRLSTFGLIVSTDILFFRKRDAAAGEVAAFAGVGLAGRGVPIRTWGRLEKSAGGELIFSYRPWLTLGRRSANLGAASGYSAGKGLLNPLVVSNAQAETPTPWLRLPPRYRGQEQALAERFGLTGIVPCGVAGALRALAGEIFGAPRGTPSPETA